MAKKYQLTQDGPEVQALLNKVEGLKANQTPGAGETPTALETLALEGVLYSVVTKAVSDLVNYYTKSETYTKAEVNTMVAAIKQFTIQSVDALPQPPSADTMNILYLVPAEEPKVANEKDEFITVIKDGSYAWEQVGSTAIDLSGYVTIEALNDTLADYVTSNALSEAIAGLHDVKYTAQTLTAEQKAQARTNIGATAPEIFWAVYGTTTAQEVQNALDAGKFVVVVDGSGRVCPYFRQDNNFIWFGGISSNQTTYVYLQKSNNSWASGGAVNLEMIGNKSQSVPTDRESEIKYPSVKAVFDSLGKWGVVSQTINWTGDATNGYEASVSDPVMGLIPQVFIDSVVAQGATFNETTGYFELNGINNIAYDEMREIDAKKTGIGQTWVGSIYFGLTYKARTNFAVFRDFGLSYSNHAPVVMHVKYMGVGQNVGGVNSNLVVLALHNYGGILYGATGGEFGNCFSGNKTLKTILGIFNVTNGGNLFYPNADCPKLETFYMRGLKADLSLTGMPSLLVSTIAYIVQYAGNTAAITLTLHATAYARCEADTTEYTYNSQTYTGILALASAHNITIAAAS